MGYSFRMVPGMKEIGMKNKALVVIDLQNDITKNYKKIIGQVNKRQDTKCM